MNGKARELMVYAREQRTVHLRSIRREVKAWQGRGVTNKKKDGSTSASAAVLKGL